MHPEPNHPEFEKVNESKQSDTTNRPYAHTSTLFSARIKLGFSLVLVTVALAYFAFTVFRGSTVSYLSVAETVGQSATEPDRQIGVLGKLVKDSYVRDPDGLAAHFAIKDEKGIKELAVTYRGEIGQVFFNDHSEIILRGKKLTDGSFTADNLTVRCPSKYLTEAEQAELQLQLQNNNEPVAPPYQPDYFDRET